MNLCIPVPLLRLFSVSGNHSEGDPDYPFFANSRNPISTLSLAYNLPCHRYLLFTFRDLNFPATIYRSPTSLDCALVLGTFSRLPTLWRSNAVSFSNTQIPLSLHSPSQQGRLHKAHAILLASRFILVLSQHSIDVDISHSTIYLRCLPSSF